MKKIVTATAITAVWFLGCKSLGELVGKLVAKILQA